MKFTVAHQEETRAARFRALDTCVPIRVGDLWNSSLGVIKIDGFTRKVSLANGTGFDVSDESGTIPWPIVNISTAGGKTKTWTGAPFFQFATLAKRGDGEEWSPAIERKTLDENAEIAAMKALKEARAFVSKINVPTEEKANKQRTLSEIDFALQLLPVFPAVQAPKGVVSPSRNAASGLSSSTTKRKP